MNPYSPPTAAPAATSAVRFHPPALAVLGLTAVQLFWALQYFALFFDLISKGAAHPAAGLAVVAGCALLLAGAVGFTLNAARGARRFCGAGVALGSSLATWRLESWSYPLLLGIGIAALGWWLARQFEARAIGHDTAL
jgi:hypothetical protein